MNLIQKAGAVYTKNFAPETWFERALFFSWYCGLRDCKFCFMSTQAPKKKAIRSPASLITEAVLCKALGWRVSFLAGGIGAYTQERFLKLLEDVVEALGHKVWLNAGPLSQAELRACTPYIEGVVAAVETINPELHSYLCPSKPISPYEEMLEYARKLGLKGAATIVLGLGETRRDYSLLKRFLQKHNIAQLHYYSLNPQKGTIFEGKPSVSASEQAWWIAKTRIDFPNLHISAGIWLSRADRVALLLKAGANSITKFPATRHFGSIGAKEVEAQARKAGRSFLGSLTELPEVELSAVPEKARATLEDYLRRMKQKIRR
jgi:biotin synthase-like enzyme